MSFYFNEYCDQSTSSIGDASPKPNYIEKLSNVSCIPLIEIEYKPTTFDSNENRSLTNTITQENNDVSVADFHSIDVGVLNKKNENPFNELIKNINQNLKQDSPKSYYDCFSSKNYNLGFDMDVEIDFNQDYIDNFYSWNEISNKNPEKTPKEGVISIERKCKTSLDEIDEIEKNYRNSKSQQSFRWFSRYSMQKKIKTQFLKFNYNKLVCLLCEKCHYKFPKFDTKNFVDINDLLFEQELFSYPNMKELMKVKDFVNGENIEIFIKTKENFKDYKSYLEFIRIISQNYSEWIREYLSYCSENYDEAEKKIKINQTKSQKNIDGERKAVIMSDYFKLFWHEAENYVDYFITTKANSRPVGGRKQTKKAKPA